MKKITLVGLALLAMSTQASAADGGAILGGAIGGGAGAAIGSQVGGRNGAIVGGAIGGGTGAAIGSQQRSQPAPTQERTRYREDNDDRGHHDNGRHLGQRKHHHGHDD